MTIKKPVCHTLLLHQKEKWKAPTSPRLPTSQLVDYQKPIPPGLYEPTVMFFGLTNSPATFQTMINMIFHNLIDEGNVTIYMDDIAIHMGARPGESNEKHLRQHRELVRHVLK